MEAKDTSSKFVATRNSCKLCRPLGASMAFAGIEKSMTLLHGSQGCSTYIRRYMISHYKEPIDIASSNFGESAVIFGGGGNFRTALENVIVQYEPEFVGIATTCLAETIGDDIGGFLVEFKKTYADQKLPMLVSVSTPSYAGTEAEGFFGTVRAIVDQAAVAGEMDPSRINLIPGMVSPADIRNLREAVECFGIKPIVLPDYSDTLDGQTWQSYSKIQPGGTTIKEIMDTGSSSATIEFCTTYNDKFSGAVSLENNFGVKAHRMTLPIGIKNTDKFFSLLEDISGTPMPEKYHKQRGRLLDSYIDAHKYVSGKRAIVVGNPELVAAMAVFLLEIGITPVVCGTGATQTKLAEVIEQEVGEAFSKIQVIEKTDYMDIQEMAAELKPEIMIASSKGYSLSRNLNIPLVRVGFPIHDRIGGGRIEHVLYEGTQRLFDVVTNTLIQAKQDNSPVGYSYM